MTKRFMSAVLALMLCVCLLPGLALAKAKQMNDGVPVWTEETVRDYALAYTTGKVMNTLWGYYDLQIRRYMPMATYENMLTELEWKTGRFQALGSYYCFEEPELQLKTHVLHLCMEKTDLDMYFTHKNKADDWEVMAVDFAYADEEPLPDDSDMLVGGASDEGEASLYDEVQVTIGKAQNAVSGTLVIPASASAENPVAGCIIVNDWDMYDRDGTQGKTTMYADLAHALGEMGIASLRYDKRAMSNAPTKDTTAQSEVIDDVLDACDLLINEAFIDKTRVVLIGHGFGAMLTPLIASESEGKVTAMVMIAGAYTTPLKQLVKQNIKELEGKTAEERAEAAALADEFKKVKKSQAQGMTIFDRNGMYFWELQQTDQVKTILKLKLPTFIVQGDKDPYVSEDEGWRAYAAALGDDSDTTSFKAFRGLNHLLMADTTLDADGMPDYCAHATLDAQAGTNISQWILSLFTDEE